MSFFSLESLTLHYGKTLAVDALSLSLDEGQTLALLGPSGCGKTTTMRAVAGLLKPSGGRVHLAGREITALAANQREVGLVFQSYALFPHLSAWDNVAFGLKLRGVNGAELKQRVGDALAMVGLADFAQRMPRELSGGQQQRVALARTVVVRPRLLLL
jgi:putative spermidine/putrescine transport system ATP-binding protein